MPYGFDRSKGASLQHSEAADALVDASSLVLACEQALHWLLLMLVMLKSMLLLCCWLVSKLWLPSLPVP